MILSNEQILTVTHYLLKKNLLTKIYLSMKKIEDVCVQTSVK